MKSGNQLRILLVLLGVVSILNSAAHGATWHVAGAGNDAGDGSEKAPFASLTKAVEAATKAGDASEIVIHAGVYRGDVVVPALKGKAAEAPAWVIRAGTTPGGGFEEVVIDGGQKVTEAAVVDAARGIYFLPFSLANFEPSMWEAQSRTRYIFAADRRAVEAFPATLAPGKFQMNGEEKAGIFFRTSDGKPPAAHDLGLARDRFGLVIQRPNVTVKGLHFRNFQLYFGVYGVSIEAANVTVDSCQGWNCYGLVGVSDNIENAKIVSCTARDVATGMKSYGKNTVVENCRFFRIEDSFVVQENEQDQCGIQFYTSNIQTARGNLCVGFQAGVFIKASGGVAILDNNTLIAPANGGDRGIGPNTWRAGTTCRGNVVMGYEEPISYGDGLSKEINVSGNVIWRASDRKPLEELVEKIKGKTGGTNLVARPLFVDEGTDDYRLAPASVGATLGPERQPIGAAGVAAAGEADKTAPHVWLEVLPPAQPQGLRSQVFVRKNTWIGGTVAEQIEDHLIEPEQAIWLAPAGEIELRIQAEDSLGKVTQIRKRLGSEEWSSLEMRGDTVKIKVPKDMPATALAVQVADGAGNWSKPAVVRVTTTVRAPQVVGTPTVTATGYGAIIAFKTDLRCVAAVEWGAGKAFDQRAEDAPDTWFRFDNNLGLEWTERITGPRLDHCIALIGSVKSGATCDFRIKLAHGADKAVAGPAGQVTLQGVARTLHVATTGTDAEGNGAPDHPLASIQFAVDRALPGDRVLVASGVYTGTVCVSHGGVEGHPIRIESAESWEVGGAVLDGRRDTEVAMRLINVAHVEVSGFEMRWYRNGCVVMHEAQDITVKDCKFWDRHWVKGRPSSNDGVVIFTCKQITLDHNVFSALNSAFRFFETEGYRITSNTAVRCFHRVASIAYSGHGYLRNNSFAFGSSFLLSLVLTDKEVASLDSDYNNFAVHLREDALALARKEGINPPQEELLTRENGDFYYGESKGMAGLSKHKADFTPGKDLDIPTLTAWREQTGQDKHSIAIHPRYVDPQNRDFRLLPNSPNVGKGENGANIGALSVAKN